MNDLNQILQPEVSIIIPVYNSAQYLRDCLESLKNQSLNSIEFLIVNDGSNDDSEDICLEYCESDTRFKYFYQENKGVSAARNLGIEKSHGAYIGFCDSDDWVEKDMFEKLLESITKNDVDFVIADFSVENGKKTEYRCHNLAVNLFEGADYLDYLRKAIIDDYYEYPPTISIWACLFRRDIIIENNIRFVPITNGEDLLFAATFSKYAKSLFYLKGKYLYHYRNTLGSASKNNYQKLKKSYIVLYQCFLNEFSSPSDSNYTSQLNALRYQLLFILLGQLLSSNLSNTFIYQEIKELLNRGFYDEESRNNTNLEIKSYFAQRVQKLIIDYWDHPSLVMWYLRIKRKKLECKGMKK